MSDLPRMYKVKEAAEILGVTQDQMRHLCRTKKIRSRNTGAMYLIAPAALAEYIDGADEPIATAS
jgi:excisionase family DNA binding protein